ncbi:hypothetical protein BF93_11395 [Brachybacterium phenoliresistens]|uniref:DUF6891 domain-containing protein n=1 Tax=Brachybacterium phenoliresistens TaxID=396014 RepID=Z9JW80_9MICO|nr:hypothetical protein [Brachybacterium phenoliresistens]EWS82459.1 hypothetical protein BF93_11395 [Brachybacterium phenoliresistens]
MSVLEPEEVLAQLRTEAMVRLALGREELEEIRRDLHRSADAEGVASARADEILAAAWVERDHLARENAGRDRSAAIRRALARLAQEDALVAEDVGEDEASARTLLEEAARAQERRTGRAVRGWVYFHRGDAEKMVDGTDVLTLRVDEDPDGGLPGRLREALAAEGIPVPSGEEDGQVLEIPEASWFPAPPGQVG